MSDDNDMTCTELAEVAAELALGVLTGRERAMAIAHLDVCEACREDVRQLMATGEQLLELVPHAEPPVGFETGVLAHLGLPTPSDEPTQPLQAVQPRLLNRPGAGPRLRAPGRSRPGRLRRALSVAAVGLAVVVAGLGGWRIGIAASPTTASSVANHETGPLASGNLLTSAHASVGQVFLYSGSPRWVYMWVDLESGNESVTCQLVTASGQLHTLGSFQLADGYGRWGSPDPGNIGKVTGARLVSATGKVLATATFID